VSEARSIECGKCGGGIPLVTLTVAVRCPHCGHRQAIGTQTQHELKSYAAEVQAKMAAANRELSQADAWRQWSDSGRTPRKSLQLGYGLMLGVPILIALVGVFLHRIGLFDIHGPGLSFIILGASYGGVLVYIVWYYAGRKRRAARKADAGASKVACPNCGAPNTMRPGQVLETCTHCGAALAPTHTIMAQGLSAAHQARRRALLERYRAERRGMAQVLSYNVANYVPFLVMGSLLPTIGFGALAFTWQMFVTGEEPFHPAIFVLWAMLAAVVGVPIAFFAYRVAQRRSIHEAMSDLARQFRGVVSRRRDDLVRWLNQYWAAEYETTWLYDGVYFHAAALEVVGFDTLVDFEPHGYRYRGSGYPARLHLVLAAFVPGVTDGGGGPRSDARTQQLQGWLATSGFELTVCEGGLLAQANPQLVKRVRKDPSSLHELAPILHAMAEIAARIGAAPVDAIE
jgi:uncharacterized Zn finger protein (UPF0148 family)